MQLTSESITAGQPIPTRYALGKSDPQTRATFSENVSPQLSWSGAPAETQAYAVIIRDLDVPTAGDDVNQEGRTVPYDLTRQVYFHWVLLNIPAGVTSLAEGLHSSGFAPRGKGQNALGGTIHGINSYTDWFAGDDDFGGDYYGYDGPFPPWNDERLHRYVFTVYALDVGSIDLPARFDGSAAVAAIKSHIIDSASFKAEYCIYPNAL